MIQNYFRIIIRSLFRNKLHTSINLISLVISLTSFMLVFIWVAGQLSYDRFFRNSENIYRINTEIKGKGTTVFSVDNAAQALDNTYPEVVSHCRVEPLERDIVIKYNNKLFNTDGEISADSNFFDFFSFKIIRGNRKTILDQSNKIVITKKYASIFFGRDDPIGKLLTIIIRGHSRQYYVSGVIDDIPENSHLKFNFVTLLTGTPYWGNGWEYTVNVSYIRLAENTDKKLFENKISGFINNFNKNTLFKLHLQPLHDIHLYSQGLVNAEDVSKPGDIKYVYIFSIVALMILLLACSNFINLSLAGYIKKLKEAGIRKIVGASRSNIILLFLFESLLLVFISATLCLLLINLILPAFNNILGSNLQFHILDYKIITGIFLVVLTVGLISGSYPAYIVSLSNPVNILHNKWFNNSKGFTIKNILLVFQFVLSIGMISAILIIREQVQYILEKGPGFSKDQVIYFNGHDIPGDPKQELLKIPSVLNVTWLSELPLSINFQIQDTEWNGVKDNSVNLYYLKVDKDFLNTFDIPVKQGRGFFDEFSLDKESYIINETAVKEMGLSKPVGTQLLCYSALKDKMPGNVIGVVKDFHFKSLHNKIEPLVLGVNFGKPWFIAVKIKAGTISRSISQIRNKLNYLYPDYFFNYKFLDQEFEAQYLSEKRMTALLSYFTLFILLISCLGLFGLMTISAEQSTKEIGIRKTLGASIAGIVIMLTRKYFLRVATSAIIACPLTYYLMNKWLEGFAYKVPFNWLIFIGSIALTFFLVFITVSWQAVKAAKANPVDSLKYE